MSNSSTAIKTVPFHGHDLITIQDGETVRVAMKPICDAIGLSWSGQYERINRHPVLSATVRVIRTVAEDGKSRELFTLPLNKLNGWLFGINATRTKPESRDKLVEYQSECFDVLWDYWSKGVAINPRTPLTPDHQRGIQKAVARRAQALPKGLQRLAYSRIYSHLKDRFDVAKYDQIPDEQYTQALAAIETCELDGEWLPAPEDSPATTFSDDDLSDLYILLCHAYVIEKKWRESRIEEALSLLHAPIGGNLHENIQMAASFARRIAKAKGQLMERSRERLGLNYGLIPLH